jgi:ribosome recycling factor
MEANQVVDNTKQKLKAAVERLSNELSKLRTGRASSAMLDGIMVEAYGSPMPLNQVANVTAPEAQLLQITPFDPNNLQAISNAIRDNQSLGLNPTDDGRIVRIPIPALTEERRREISKQVGIKLEDTMIVMRSIRHEAIDAIEKAKKDKEIGEDEGKRLTTQVEDAMNSAKSDAELVSKAKEQEIMTV